MNNIKLKSPKEQRYIYQNKPIIQLLYKKWYSIIDKEINTNNDITIEIGSGSGPIQNFLPNVYKSDISYNKWLDIIINAESLPFKNNSIKNFIMIDVLHHLNNPESFFNEIINVLQKSGKIVIMEPFGSIISLPIYKFMHHEPFELNKKVLKKPKNYISPNQAVSQILFKKEIKEFYSLFGNKLIISKFSILPTIIYPLSGGYKKFSLIPKSMFTFFSFIEKILTPFSKLFSFRSLIIIEKI